MGHTLGHSMPHWRVPQAPPTGSPNIVVVLLDDLGFSERYERQQAMSLIEANAGFAPRNPGVPAWDDLSQAERALYASHMEVYAGLVDNADQNLGRVIDFLEATGQLDNTLIICTSDNGANSVGGPTGTVNLQGRRSGLPEDMGTVAQVLKQGRMGSEDTYAAYPTGWTQVSNTPYRYYKRTPMAGGIRVPLIAHWPRGVDTAGATRRQWVHVTDLLPTVLDITQGSYPELFNGYRMRQMDGKSFAAMFSNEAAPQQRERQYYELQGNRGFISGRWKIVSLQVPRQPIALSNWMLFNIDSDPAELDDVAAQYPDVLARLVAEFEEDATANYVYPLDVRDDLRAITMPSHELVRGAQARDFLPAAQWVPSHAVSPLLADRSFLLRAQFEWKAGDEGVIVAIGDRFAGMALFVKEGQLFFVYQHWYSPIELAPITLTPGAQDFVLAFKALGERKGEGRFTLNGAECAAGAELSPTLVRVPSGGLTVGLNRRQSVSLRYADRGTFRYTGRIARVRIEPGEQAPGTPMVIDEAAVQARMRAATRPEVRQSITT